MENLSTICIILVCAISTIIWIYLQFKNAATCIEDENGNIIKYVTMEDEDKMLKCTGYKYSNCCGDAFLDGTDVCSHCLEHASPECQDCHLYDVCENENKPNLQRI